MWLLFIGLQACELKGKFLLTSSQTKRPSLGVSCIFTFNTRLAVMFLLIFHWFLSENRNLPTLLLKLCAIFKKKTDEKLPLAKRERSEDLEVFLSKKLGCCSLPACEGYNFSMIVSQCMKLFCWRQKMALRQMFAFRTGHLEPAPIFALDPMCDLSKAIAFHPEIPAETLSSRAGTAVPCVRR